MSGSNAPSGEEVFEAYDSYLASELQDVKPTPAYVAQLQARETAPPELIRHWEQFLQDHLAQRLNDPVLERVREEAQAAYNFKMVVDTHAKA